MIQAFRSRPPFSIAIACTLSAAGIAFPALAESDALNADLEAIREAGSPAVGVAVVRCGSSEVRVSGVREMGRPEPIGPEAVFNIGSNAKSMLASAAIALQAQGALSLDDDLSALWPEEAARHPEKAGITLAQLLAHTSGLPAFSSGKDLDTVPQGAGNGTTEREAAARFFLSQSLENEPGAKLVYSNAGYVVASAILERVSGLSLEALLQRHVFGPARFMASVGEPRVISPNGLTGHYGGEDGLQAYLEDEPPIPLFLQGAGYVSLTTADYARYVEAHLCALQSKGDFLSSADARRLHGRGEADAAPLGWGSAELGGALVSFHVGGTGDFTAFMAVSESQDKGAVALLNASGPASAAAQAWLVRTMTPATTETSAP
ncbi:MAG: beta-lactamase family protein [Erythrobacter sp.]|nr:beta-lactamase family protein [Erythrobacter sp.]